MSALMIGAGVAGVGPALLAGAVVTAMLGAVRFAAPRSSRLPFVGALASAALRSGVMDPSARRDPELEHSAESAPREPAPAEPRPRLPAHPSASEPVHRFERVQTLPHQPASRLSPPEYSWAPARVPFSLADTSHLSAPRVDISLVGATQPLPLHTVYSHMQKADPSWGTTALHVLIGKRLPVGLRTDERVLPINHELTAVGHVRRGSDGRPAIFASPKFPFFLFPESKAGMMQKLNQRWGSLLGWGVLLSAAAAGVIGLAVWKSYRRRQVRRQRRQQVEQAELERWMAILLERQQQTASPPPLLPLIPHQDVPAPASQAAVAAAVGAGRAGKVDGDSPREAAADRITSSSPPPYSPSGRTGAGKPGGSGGSSWSRQSWNDGWGFSSRDSSRQQEQEEWEQEEEQEQQE
ncbi:unnamed protein product [Closterium sp. NIES-64]|nr:unnamed protein product [Closterium sp. NIES-64]